jgi:Bacterial aa3 type cytochrome c oxidase subunit IV
MAVVDPQFRQHYQTWIGFTRLIKFGLAAIVILLVAMAIFLL